MKIISLLPKLGKAGLCLALSIGLLAATATSSIAGENRDLDQAKEKMQSRDFDGALRNLNEVLGSSRTDPEGFMLRGRCFFALKTYDKAIDDFNMALKLSPNYFPAFMWRGSSHAKFGADDLAIKDFEQAIRLNPRLAKRYFKSPGLKERGQSKAVEAAERFHIPGVSAEEYRSKAVQDYKEAMARIYPNGLSASAPERVGGANPETYATDAEDQTYLTDMAAGDSSKAYSDAAPRSRRTAGAESDGSSGNGSVTNANANEHSAAGKSHKRKGHKQAGNGYYQALADRSAQSTSTDNEGNLDIGRSDETLDPKKNLRVTRQLGQDPNSGEFGAVVGSQPLEGDAETVIKRCTEALRTDNSNGENYYLRAKAYQKLAKVDKAYQDYCDAMRNGPQVAKYYIGRASLFYQLNKPLLVDADVKRAQDIDPQMPHLIHFGGEKYPSSVRWSGDGPSGD